MICPQCGALAEDTATVCENCGMVLAPEVKEDTTIETAIVPVLKEKTEEILPPPARDNNLFVKWVSVICAIVCFLTFMLAATTVETSSVTTQVPSVFGGIFGSSQAGLPKELAGALAYAFTGMAFAFSGLILIAGFKKK